MGIRIGMVTAALVAALIGVVLIGGEANAQSLTCAGRTVTIVGDNGPNNIVGTNGPDVVWAGAGDDTIDLLGGDDVVCAGPGRDRIYGRDGVDEIYGGDDIDYVWGGAGADVIYGEGGSDRLRGGSGADVIEGGSGADRIWGNGNADQLFGQGGQDFIWGGDGNDFVQGNWQTDRIWGGDGDDTLAAAGGMDTIYGGPGNDVLNGGDNTDRLSGDGGNDTLSGGNGTDTLVGGGGVDTLNGGRHTDSCFRETGETALSCETRRTGYDPIHPGAGVTAKVSRANWSSGYVQAQIVHDLLEELDYTADDPSEREYAPDLAYWLLADGDAEVWANSWYPGHLYWWDQPTSNGTPASDNLARVATKLIPGGGRQGLLVTKAWADNAGFTTLDQINADPALWGALDSDGNGKGEIYGCAREWTCDDIIDSQIAFAGWSNLEQVYGGYDAMFADFMAKVRAGQPAVAYTWTPTSYYAEAQPGELTMWLSVNNSSVLDDSNPLGRDGGSQYDQRPGYSGESSDHCLIGPNGCQLGWAAADIEITANRAWLAANPAAEALFNQMQLPLVDMSVAGADLSASSGTQADVERIAAAWIEANRLTVDAWLEEVRWN